MDFDENKEEEIEQKYSEDDYVDIYSKRRIKAGASKKLVCFFHSGSRGGVSRIVPQDKICNKAD